MDEERTEMLVAALRDAQHQPPVVVGVLTWDEPQPGGQMAAVAPIADSCALSRLRGAVHPIRWKKQLGDISTSELKELRQLREENRKLKQLVADLSLDKTILREALTKKF
jgi:putative transposase